MAKQQDWLNYLMVAGLFGILAVVAWAKINPPGYSPTPPLKQFYQLMNLGPVVKDSFRIDPDYDELKLIVTLDEPVENSQRLFFQWLSANGYDQIPAEKIVIRWIKSIGNKYFYLFRVF